MSKLMLVMVICLCMAARVQSQTKEIIWDHIGQSVQIKKGEDYFFNYQVRKTPCLRVEITERGDNQIFTLLSNCDTDRVVTLPPDTLMINCDGEVLRTFKGGQTGNVKSDVLPKNKTQKTRAIVWKNFGQREKITKCEWVTFVYSSGVQPEDADFTYEQVDDGYYLELKMVGQISELNFDCICKRFEVANPQSYRFKVVQELRYEQVIMTPMVNDFWEIRIGTIVERKCKSPAKISLSEKKTKDYEAKLTKKCK